MAETIGTGNFVSWDGGCLFISRAVAPTPVHAHYAIQLAFGSTPGIRFRTDDHEPWTAFDGVVIPSRQPHAMDASVVPYGTVIFVEPETREGRALAERFGARALGEVPREGLEPRLAALFAAWQEQRSEAAIAAAAQAIIRELTGGVVPTVVSDERILRATTYIRTHLDSALTLEEVAAVACLSPSRFRHLFVEETGMALRAYILWRRFLHVWEHTMRGQSLSAAAHSAGFADAAHLTRTCRRIFGFPPSALQPGQPLQRGNALPSLPSPGVPARR